MAQGKVALVKVNNTDRDGKQVSVLLLEVTTGKQKITITDKEQPINAAIRECAERLIELVQGEHHDS